jgi:hypothetical protein
VKPSLLIALLLFASPPAFARFGVVPLDMAVSRSAAVVDATILAARTASYHHGELTDSCGFIYEAEVTQAFKGSLAGRILFASNVAMKPGSRHLLFLRSYRGDFPSDGGPALEKDERIARDACIAALPMLKSDYLQTGEFLPSNDRRSHFVAVSYWLGLPPDLPATRLEVRDGLQDGTAVQLQWTLPGGSSAPTLALDAYHVDKRFVEWPRLRAWLLQNVPDLVDTFRTETGCEDACVTQALAETIALVNRLRERERRTHAGRPDVVAAIDAGQQAWEQSMQATCRGVASAWRAHELVAALSRECPLGFMQARARELWLLRNAPDCSDESPEGGCYDAEQARAQEKDEPVDFQLQRARRRFADDRQASAAIDADQRAWTRYLQAHCRAVRMVWRESDEDAPHGRACWLRLTGARYGELLWAYESAPVYLARRRAVPTEAGEAAEAR